MAGQPVYLLILLKPIRNLKYGLWPVRVLSVAPVIFSVNGACCIIWHFSAALVICKLHFAVYMQIALCSLHYAVPKCCIVMPFEQRGRTRLYFF